MAFRTSEAQILRTAKREGFRAKAYRLKSSDKLGNIKWGNWTVGYGQENELFPGTPGAIRVTEGLTISRELAWDALCFFVYNVADPLVTEYCNPQTQDEHDACSSWVYNIRHSILKKEQYTLPKLIERADRSPKAMQEIADCWVNYCLTPGAESGLYRRRLEELVIFHGLPLTLGVLGHINSARVRRLDKGEPADGATYQHPKGQFAATVSPQYVLDMAEAAKPIPAEPDPPQAPEPVKPVEEAPIPPIDASQPPKKIEESRTGKALNRKSRGGETVGIGGLGIIFVTIAQQIETVGRSLESIGMETMLKVGLFAFIGLLGFGAWMWWDGRNTVHHARQVPQDPKY